jgi:hypothetical protein
MCWLLPRCMSSSSATTGSCEWRSVLLFCACSCQPDCGVLQLRQMFLSVIVCIGVLTEPKHPTRHFTNDHVTLATS